MDQDIQDRIKQFATGVPHVPDPKGLQIDYNSQHMEAFVAVLQSELSAHLDISSWNIGSFGNHDDIPNPHFAVMAKTDKGETITLRIFAGEDIKTGYKKVFFVIDSNKVLAAAELDVWNGALKMAVGSYKQKLSLFSWQAALVQLRDGRHGSPHGVSGEINVAEIAKVRSSGSPYVMRKATGRAVPSVPFVYTTDPLIVEGQHEGYEWFTLRYSVAEDVNKLSSLLSIAWGSTWTLLIAPQQGGVRIPSEEPTFQSINHTTLSPSPTKTMPIPAWFDSAYLYLEDNFDVRNAVAMYNQAILVEYEHPTLAMLAYIASLETIGIILAKKEGLSKTKIKKLTKTALFEKAVRFVISDKAEADEVVGMYKTRGYSAHESVLFGDESAYGLDNSPPSIFGEGSASWLFKHMPLRNLKETNRRALIGLFEDNFKC